MKILIVILCTLAFSLTSISIHAFSDGELEKLLDSSDDFDIEVALSYLSQNRNSFYNDEKTIGVAKSLIVNSNSISVQSLAFHLLLLLPSESNNENAILKKIAKSIAEKSKSKNALAPTKFYIQNSSLTLDKKVVLLSKLKSVAARIWLINYLLPYLSDDLSIKNAFIPLVVHQDSSTVLAFSLLSKKGIRDDEILEHLVTTAEGAALYANQDILKYISQYGVEAYDYAPRLIQMYEDVQLKGSIYGDKTTVLRSIEAAVARIRAHSKYQYDPHTGSVIRD